MIINTKADMHRIYVTGATGWIGKTFLHELQSIIPAKKFNDMVMAFGSNVNLLNSTNYPKHKRIIIPVHPLSELKDHLVTGKILLFHSAFLTKDRIPSYGINAFIETNRQITDTVLKFLRRCENSRVVNMSSGAASIAEKKGDLTLTEKSDPYGFLKLYEEKQISAITSNQVFRIYALTGRFIRDPQKFAIGDFITQALQNKPIVINSPYPVIRSYVSASDVAKCSIKWLLSEDKPIGPIETSSHVTTLTALGELVASQYGQPRPTIKTLTGAANSYSCSPIYFERILRKYRIKPLTMTEQISDTEIGLRLNHI